MTLPQHKGIHALHQTLPALIRLWRDYYQLPGPPTQLRATEVTRIAHQLQQLSFGLTRDRKLAGLDYFQDPYQFGAYLFFFWPVSYSQAHFVLEKLATPAKSILEIGAGAAPLSIAALELGAKVAVALDRSPTALAFGKKNALHQKKHITTQMWHGNTLGLPAQQRFELISFQHILNELWLNDSQREQKLLKFIDLTAKSHLTSHGHLVILEPALTETSRVLLRIRDTLIQQGYHIVAPCTIQSPCPALFKPTDSCHIDWQWTPPQLIKNLAKQSGFKKNDLKMTYLIVQLPTAPPPNKYEKNVFLIVSEPMVSKNKRVRLIGCGPQGRIGLALHPKNRSESNQLFFSLKRGDLISLSCYSYQENSIKLDQGSNVKIVK